MAQHTRIEWAHHTFNPWWGCEKVSAACANCYAERDSQRWGFDLWGAEAERRRFGSEHWRAPERWNESARRRGVRERVFCASMADVFEARADVGADRWKLFALIERTESLDWMLLTKRPKNVSAMVPESWMTGRWPPNAWLGVTAEDQANADRRIPTLFDLPAPVRFVSAEPLLGPIDFLRFFDWSDIDGEIIRPPLLHWIIVGGESGPCARPTDPRWIESVLTQCRSRGIPFFFKQWGTWAPESDDWSSDPSELIPLRRMSKSAAGRKLRGVEYSELPACRP